MIVTQRLVCGVSCCCAAAQASNARWFYVGSLFYVMRVAKEFAQSSLIPDNVDAIRKFPGDRRELDNTRSGHNSVLGQRDEPNWARPLGLWRHDHHLALKKRRACAIHVSTQFDTRAHQTATAAE